MARKRKPNSAIAIPKRQNPEKTKRGSSSVPIEDTDSSANECVVDFEIFIDDEIPDLIGHWLDPPQEIKVDSAVIYGVRLATLSLSLDEQKRLLALFANLSIRFLRIAVPPSIAHGRPARDQWTREDLVKNAIVRMLKMLLDDLEVKSRHLRHSGPLSIQYDEWKVWLLRSLEPCDRTAVGSISVDVDKLNAGIKLIGEALPTLHALSYKEVFDILVGLLDQHQQKVVAVRLQDYLNNFEYGVLKSLDHKRLFCQQLMQVLDRIGLRVKCPTCKEPAIIRAKSAATSTDGVFLFEHSRGGKKHQHGGKTRLESPLELLTRPTDRRIRGQTTNPSVPK